MLKLKSFYKLGFFVLGIGTLFFCLTMAASADSQTPRGMGGPPTETLEACASSTKGDSCSFSSNGENLEGNCESSPRDEKLVCRPEGVGAGGGKMQGQKRGEMRNGGINQKEEVDEANRRQRNSNVDQRTAYQRNNSLKVINKVEKIIVYLEGNSIDAADIKIQLGIFESKTDDLIAAYAKHVELKESSEESSVDIETAKEEIRVFAKSAKTYFIEILKPTIQSSLAELT